MSRSGCVCVLEGLRKSCLALGPWPGRHTQLQAVFSDSLSVSTPASAPVVFPSSQAAGSCHCWGTCPSSRGRPMGSLAPVSLQHAAHALSLCLCPHLPAHLSLPPRLQAAASSVILVSGHERKLWSRGFLLPILQCQAQSNRAGRRALAGWPSALCAR